MRKLIIESEAEADIAAAHNWYEEQREGLGDEFEMCLEAGLQTVQQRPKAFQKVHGNVRRFLIHRFPYAILYMERTSAVVVVAVFHARRDPQVWQERMK